MGGEKIHSLPISKVKTNLLFKGEKNMDKRLEIVCEEMNEHLTDETISVIEEFLEMKPDYPVEKLRRDFVFLKFLLNKNVSLQDLEMLRKVLYN